MPSFMKIEQYLDVEKSGEKKVVRSHLSSIYHHRSYSLFWPTLSRHKKSSISNFGTGFFFNVERSLRAIEINNQNAENVNHGRLAEPPKLPTLCGDNIAHAQRPHASREGGAATAIAVA